MRDIPVGNGSLLVTFDEKYQIRDVYFPHVGQENHTEGFPFRFGSWVRGQSQQNLSFVRFKKYAHGLFWLIFACVRKKISAFAEIECIIKSRKKILSQNVGNTFVETARFGQVRP